MKTWQHEETGRICQSKKRPSKRYYEVVAEPKTGAQRVANSEARKRESGLVKNWTWVYLEDKEKLRSYALKLRTKRERAI